MPVEIEQLIVWDEDAAEESGKSALEEIRAQMEKRQPCDWLLIEKVIKAQESLGLIGSVRARVGEAQTKEEVEKSAAKIAGELAGQLIRNEVHERSDSAVGRAIAEIRSEVMRRFVEKYAANGIAKIARS